MHPAKPLLLVLSAGVVAIVAIGRRGERSPAVFLSVPPLALVVLFVAAELLVGRA